MSVLPSVASSYQEALRVALTRQDYPSVITLIRQAVQADRRALTDPLIKSWLALRWQNLFLQLAAQDRAAVKVARGVRGYLGDKREAMQVLAERFLVKADPASWQPNLPPVVLPQKLNATLIFCPGFINGLLPVHAFEHEFDALEQQLGLRAFCADAHPVRSCEANVSDLLAAIEAGEGFKALKGGASEPVKGPDPGDVVLMGYSKGSADILALLAQHPGLKDRIKAVYTWAGAIGGSHTADTIYQLIADLPLDAAAQRLHDFLAMLMPGVTRQGTLRRLDEYDILGAVRSLTTTEREAFLAHHGAAIDALNVPFFNVTGSTKLLEVPTFQMLDYQKLSKFDPDNDMQVTQAQATLALPMSTHVATLHGHHWDIAYPPFPRKMRMTTPNLDHPFPRKAGIMANLMLVAELGLIGSGSGFAPAC
jgi:hypothetical protein